MKNIFLVLFCFVLLQSCSVDNNNKQNSNTTDTVLTVADVFLLNYEGNIGSATFPVVIANWGDGVCSGYWENPFTKTRSKLSGEIDLDESLRLWDESGFQLKLAFADPLNTGGYILKKEADVRTLLFLTPIYNTINTNQKALLKIKQMEKQQQSLFFQTQFPDKQQQANKTNHTNTKVKQ